MSLIADALKTAQRERLRRESGGVDSAISPILVPLRTKPQPSFSWRQAVTIAISGIVTIAAIVVMVQRLKKTPPPLSALPPITSALSGRAIGADPDKGARRNTAGRASASRPLPASAGRSRQQSPTTGRVATATAAPARVRPDSGAEAVPQGQSRLDSAKTPAVAPAAERPAGRLRIAVEQPADAQRLFAEALAAHRADDLPTARGLYERVLLVAPNHADALNNLGVLLSGQREFDRALELLRRAASVAPNSAGTWNNIGTALREQGRGSDAVAAFRHALTLDPQHQGAKVGLAQQYLAIGSITQARGLLEDVLASNPVLPEAHHALGQALERQGDRIGAIRAYSAFIRLAPPRLASHVERTRRHLDSLSGRVW